MIDYPSRLCCCFAAVLFCCVPTLADAAKKASTRKVVLIAGDLDGGHPKGTHEYEKTVRLLKHCLETSSNLKGVKAEVHYHGLDVLQVGRRLQAVLQQADSLLVLVRPLGVGAVQFAGDQNDF